MAYKARNRGDLMAGIDEFLDKVTVLPPGEWDPQIRLEPPSKVPSQAKRKNTVDGTKLSIDMADGEPFKCKHCKTSMDHSSPVRWTRRYVCNVYGPQGLCVCLGVFVCEFCTYVCVWICNVCAEVHVCEFMYEHEIQLA